jgi:hypothetical protein
LYADGTVLELVRLDRSDERKGALTNEELDRWIETFPVESPHSAYLQAAGQKAGGC